MLLTYINPIKILLVYMADVYTDAIIIGMVTSGANMVFTNIVTKTYDYFYKKESIPIIILEEDKDWVHVNYLSSQI